MSLFVWKGDEQTEYVKWDIIRQWGMGKELTTDQKWYN